MIVSILGRPYAVKWSDKKSFTKHLYGECNHEKLTITIASKLHPAHEHEILIHEILHAIWDIQQINQPEPVAATLPDFEEGVVRSLAVGLSTVFMNNPTLVEYLAALKTEVQGIIAEAA